VCAAFHHINSPTSLTLLLQKKIIQDHPFLHTPLYKVRLQEAATAKQAARVERARLKAQRKQERAQKKQERAVKKQERLRLRRAMSYRAREVGAWPVYPSSRDDLVERDPTPESDLVYPRFVAWMESSADVYWTLL
jgi:hypothetical protein